MRTGKAIKLEALTASACRWETEKDTTNLMKDALPQASDFFSLCVWVQMRGLKMVNISKDWEKYSFRARVQHILDDSIPFDWYQWFDTLHKMMLLELKFSGRISWGCFILISPNVLSPTYSRNQMECASWIPDQPLSSLMREDPLDLLRN